MHRSSNRRNQLFVPLMPKGVEHRYSAVFFNTFSTLFVPLMPKGVEHVNSVAERLEQGESAVCSVDAERR